MTAKPATVHDLNEKATAIAAAQPMEHATLAAALVAALAELTVVEKGRSVTVAHKGGGSHSYDYADIADVVKLTRPVLARHGIVALTPVHGYEGALACTVTLLHASGDRLDLGPFPFPHGHDAQATGSVVTYHRRYALVAALGIAAGDDDDGASARPRQAAPEPTVSKADHDAIAAVRASLCELTSEVCSRLVDDAIVRAGADSLDAVLADEGWRKWLAAAIDHHLAQPAEEPTLPLDGA